jgi:hypothetical protein
LISDYDEVGHYGTPTKAQETPAFAGALAQIRGIIVAAPRLDEH